MDTKHLSGVVMGILVGIIFITVGFLSLFNPDKIAEKLYRDNLYVWESSGFTDKAIKRWVKKPPIRLIRLFAVFSIAGGFLTLYAIIKSLE